MTTPTHNHLRLREIAAMLNCCRRKAAVVVADLHANYGPVRRYRAGRWMRWNEDDVLAAMEKRSEHQEAGA